MRRLVFSRLEPRAQVEPPEGQARASLAWEQPAELASPRNKEITPPPTATERAPSPSGLVLSDISIRWFGFQMERLRRQDIGDRALSAYGPCMVTRVLYTGSIDQPVCPIRG